MTCVRPQVFHPDWQQSLGCTIHSNYGIDEASNYKHAQPFQQYICIRQSGM